MIRTIAVVSLLGLLILVLYVPSSHPPEMFIKQLRAEYKTAAAFWGEDAALRMLSRAMRTQDSARQITPIPSPQDAAPTNAVNSAVGHEMASVNLRLFNNAYFRAIDALLLLASFRFAMLWEWLPSLLVFIGAAVMDGSFVRLVKSKELLHDDPEMFALYVSTAILVSCSTVLAFVWPISLHPLIVPCVPLVIGVLLGLAVQHFHRRT